MKTVVTFLVGIALIFSIALATYVVFVRSGEYLKVSQDTHTLDTMRLKNDIVDGCLKNSNITSSNAEGTKIAPNMDLFELCLRDKGLGDTLK